MSTSDKPEASKLGSGTGDKTSLARRPKAVKAYPTSGSDSPPPHSTAPSVKPTPSSSDTAVSSKAGKIRRLKVAGGSKKKEEPRAVAAVDKHRKERRKLQLSGQLKRSVEKKGKTNAVTSLLSGLTPKQKRKVERRLKSTKLG